VTGSYFDADKQVEQMLADFEKRKAEAEDAETVSPRMRSGTNGADLSGREDTPVPRR
jgi:hypothetical protein